MEELRFVTGELERVHQEYLNRCKEIWTNNEVSLAEKMAKKEYVSFRNKEKMLQLIQSKLESALEDLSYYKR